MPPMNLPRDPARDAPGLAAIFFRCNMVSDFQDLAKPMLRIATFIVIGIAAAAWFLFVMAFIHVAEPGPGISFAAIGVTSAAFLVFALPALILAWGRKFLGLALALALLSLAAIVLVG